MEFTSEKNKKRIANICTHIDPTKI